MILQRIEEIAHKTPGVKHTVANAGQSVLLNANAPNFGSMFVMLDDFHKRARHDLSGDAIADLLQRRFTDEIPDGIVNVFGAPTVEGLSTAGEWVAKSILKHDETLITLAREAQQSHDGKRRMP